MVTTMVDAGRAQRTVSITLFVVRSVFDDALQDGLLVRNPAARVKAAGRPQRNREAFTGEELVRLQAHIADDERAGLWLLTTAGLRRSEILGLRWSDVDLQAGTVTIVRGETASRSGGRAEPTATKTRRGARDFTGAL